MARDGGDDRRCHVGAGGSPQVLRQLVASTAEAELGRMHRAKVFEAQTSEAPVCRVSARDGRQFHHTETKLDSLGGL